MRYDEWRDEVEAEWRENLGQELGEMKLSERLLKSHWRAGSSPAEFVHEMADSMHSEIEEEPFDIRYDL